MSVTELELSLTGKVCIITGAAGGIGKKITELFALAGAKVYAVDIQGEKLNSWVMSWNEKHNGKIITACKVDICDSLSIKTLIQKIKKESKTIDVLVNDAALISYEFLSMVSKEKMKKMFDVNVFGMIEIMQYVSRVMMKQNTGSIINIASMVAVKGVCGQFSYSASKGAVISLTKSAAKELASYKIRVNAVAPGMVATERFNKVLKENFSEKQGNIPFGRLAEEIEIAELCLFLASEKSKYITGQIIGIDGGLVL